jgi:hypothetical protein
MRLPALLLRVGFVTLTAACADATVAVDPDPTPVTPVTPVPTPPAGGVTLANVQLVGGWRLDVAFASEGLAVVTDGDGVAVEALAGAHVQTQGVHLYDLATPPGSGSDVAQYPLLTPRRTWTVAELFPRWISGQTLRDLAAVRTATGYDLAGIGRVFYNTAPRSSTQISVRGIGGRGAGATLGATREIPVDLPEQEFSGFIKHSDPTRDLGAIGAGAYDSGQGSVAGLSYAVRTNAGTWTRLLRPPPFGDLTSPRLPRDTAYSCPDGASWVCLPPVGGRGVWSTERIGGGGVRVGDDLLFLATLGYGPRRYGRQTYTFGDPALDRAVAYVFTQDATGAVHFRGYERWPHAAPGELVIGTALARWHGTTALHLFVVTSNAWGTGRDRTGSVLQVFRLTGSLTGTAGGG